MSERPPKGTAKADLIARHKGKMMGKHFRRLEQGYGTLLRPDQKPRPNMSERALRSHYSLAERRKFVRIIGRS